MKESFVKAIGTGVGYRLDGVEFHHRDWTNICVKINGKELKDWKFWLSSIGKNYAVRYLNRRFPMLYSIALYCATVLIDWYSIVCHIFVC